ncbi:hypothetical protein K474DRAFT_1671222 [Panus rudis PR-1116 ss-1]|nr:hypothetical protein K474DRAFT_1671222 [Panus rudis PR-1116 ss-1]
MSSSLTANSQLRPNCGRWQYQIHQRTPLSYPPVTTPRDRNGPELSAWEPANFVTSSSKTQHAFAWVTGEVRFRTSMYADHVGDHWHGRAGQQVGPTVCPLVLVPQIGVPQVGPQPHFCPFHLPSPITILYRLRAR